MRPTGFNVTKTVNQWRDLTEGIKIIFEQQFMPSATETSKQNPKAETRNTKTRKSKHTIIHNFIYR